LPPTRQLRRDPPRRVRARTSPGTLILRESALVLSSLPMAPGARRIACIAARCSPRGHFPWRRIRPQAPSIPISRRYRASGLHDASGRRGRRERGTSHVSPPAPAGSAEPAGRCGVGQPGGRSGHTRRRARSSCSTRCSSGGRLNPRGCAARTARLTTTLRRDPCGSADAIATRSRGCIGRLRFASATLGNFDLLLRPRSYSGWRSFAGRFLREKRLKQRRPSDRYYTAPAGQGFCFSADRSATTS